MLMHPDHAAILANTRHRELIEEADEFRRAQLAAPPRDCRTPVGAPACRPDVRRRSAPTAGVADAASARRRRPRAWRSYR
jgi:hypothetical protein